MWHCDPQEHVHLRFIGSDHAAGQQQHHGVQLRRGRQKGGAAIRQENPYGRCVNYGAWWLGVLMVVAVVATAVEVVLVVVIVGHSDVFCHHRGDVLVVVGHI